MSKLPLFVHLSNMSITKIVKIGRNASFDELSEGICRKFKVNEDSFTLTMEVITPDILNRNKDIRCKVQIEDNDDVEDIETNSHLYMEMNTAAEPPSTTIYQASTHVTNKRWA